MPPTLDLSRTSHTKMIVSPPRINLRKAASYNHDRGPLSSTSSRFNFNHLIASPPPSPGLPSLSPPLKKSPKGLAGFVRPSRIIRYTVWLMVALILISGVDYFLRFAFSYDDEDFRFMWFDKSGTRVARDSLPDTTKPILFIDKHGKTKWTVVVPRAADSSPSASELAETCNQCRVLSEYIESVGGSREDDFIDVKEAQEGGYLPGLAKGSVGVSQHGSGLLSKELKPVCEKSLTFVLESTGAGLGDTLMMLWTAYGIAKKEGRAFFIDDSRWAYGKYADMFQPPPSLGCSPPPRHQLVPCPRQARHLVVSSTPKSELFAPSRSKFFSSDRSEVRNYFNIARAGHNALFRLTPDDASYVERRTRELMARRIPPKSKGTTPGVAVGVHVRRGDLHPVEPQYRRNYIPLQKYSEAIRSLTDDKLGSSSSPAKQHSFTILASDDPTVYDADELPNSVPAQDRIKLASKQPKEVAPPDRKFMRKFIDESVGWEGGFYESMFWTLGAPKRKDASSHAPAPGGGHEENENPSEEMLRLRSLVGRAYLMDLAVLADASDAVVCTASSAGCRVLAVMMGWEGAMEKGLWVNIDKGAEWEGVGGAMNNKRRAQGVLGWLSEKISKR
ncbi:hypothetical protein B0T16DRAFT_62252 [Cercophora newfieldiana]|uniref:Uncharacterized protein n=1 Tax=Cercophora newfieldiana TaxID=92897 RepID=A0AA40CZN2_9PEZI|nr:hypothetical protein B0T16DRAFT_62252 [Cercophora newfieldiana]